MKTPPAKARGSMPLYSRARAVVPSVTLWAVSGWLLHSWSRAKGGLSGEVKAERAMSGHSLGTKGLSRP